VAAKVIAPAETAKMSRDQGLRTAISLVIGRPASKMSVTVTVC
jgi:hypothetical protein